VEKFDKVISEIVREDYRTAEVFKKYGINYCCGGNAFLKDTCISRNLDYAMVTTELLRATKDVYVPNFLQFEKWNIVFLTDYILNVHHAYLKTATPSIQAAVSAYALSHAKQHPEIIEVEKVFNYLTALLTTHNLHEEEIIFPYIKHIEATHRRKETYGSLFVRTLRKPLDNIQKDHIKVSDLLAQLREITNNYEIPEKACTNHRVVLCRLKEFDNDLIQHKHLENNILFPKAIQLETELLQSQIT
jgi:regulator of cell morphogenesis and NO signaling